MYEMMNCQSGKAIKAQTVKDLVRDLHTSRLHHNPSPSTIVREAIERGEYVPVSGPDWFMTLHANDELISNLNANHFEMNAEYERTKAADNWLISELKTSVDGQAALGIAGVIRSDDWDRIKFTSPEREAWIKSLAAEYWRRVEGK